MLSISKPMHGSARASYYFGQESQESVLGAELSPSQWMGGLAEEMGLGGRVEKETLKNLFDGRSPDGSTNLVKNAGSKSRQSAWDLTFSAPKSVSVLLAFSDSAKQRKIIEAHEQAVRAALKHIESVAGFTRRGHGGKTLERTSLLFATFRHSLSRENEPNLHTHASLINVAKRSDSTFGTLYTKEIFREKCKAGAIYRDEFAFRLSQELRLEIEATSASFRLVDVPQSVCSEFSTRRKQIEAVLKQKGWTGAIAAKSATVRTRKGKEAVDLATLVGGWSERAEVHGFGRDKVREIYERAIRQSQAPGEAFAEKAPQTPTTRAEPHVNKPPLERRPPPITITTNGRAAQEAQAKERRGKGDGPVRAPKSWRAVLPIPKIVVKRSPLFPKAPGWSPFSKVTVSHLEISFRSTRRKRASSRPQHVKNFRVLPLQIQKKQLFPNAPGWSPAKKIALPYLAVKTGRPEAKRNNGIKLTL